MIEKRNAKKRIILKTNLLRGLRKMVVEIVRGVYKNMIVASKYSYSYNQIVRTNNLFTYNILLDYLLRYLDFLIS